MVEEKGIFNLDQQQHTISRRPPPLLFPASLRSPSLTSLAFTFTTPLIHSLLTFTWSHAHSSSSEKDSERKEASWRKCARRQRAI